MPTVQDFSKKLSIVVRKDLEPWQVLNTVAHISAYLGNKLGNDFGTGEYFVTKDGAKHPRNSQYAIVVLSGEQVDLYPLILEARKQNLFHINFLREMLETTNDAEIEQLVGSKTDESLEYLGVGVFGDKDLLKTLTKKLSLWK